MSTYTHQVNFEKVFVSGNLTGRRYANAYIRFCTLEDAQAFAAKEGQVMPACAGNDSYRVEYPVITELE